MFTAKNKPAYFVNLFRSGIKKNNKTHDYIAEKCKILRRK
jgi:hypothetical protein